jgi:hypothetical protein
MKKNFLAAIALMLTSAAFAQVDSTTQSSPSNDYSKSGAQTDTVTTSQSDTLSNEGSGTSSQMPSSTDSAGNVTSSGAVGTDSASSATITDEDIRKYAEVMDSVNAMKQELLGEITDKVKGNPKITVSRYMELSKANGDEAKLAQLKATPDEVAFVKEVGDFKNEGASKISENFQTLVKQIGVEKYNAIKEQLETDTAMKAKYDAIMAELKKDDADTKTGAPAKPGSTGTKPSTKTGSGTKSTTK